MNEKRKKANRVAFFVIGIALICALIVIGVLFAQAKANREYGLANAQRIYESMTLQGNLPWTTDDYKLIAVIDCGDRKIFVESQQTFGSEILNCSYFVAQNVEIVHGVDPIATERGTLTFREYVSPSE